MPTRTIKSEDAAAAAEIARLVRTRAEDLVDPRLPASEMEALVDMGASVVTVTRPRISGTYLAPRTPAAMGVLAMAMVLLPIERQPRCIRTQ